MTTSTLITTNANAGAALALDAHEAGRPILHILAILEDDGVYERLREECSHSPRFECFFERLDSFAAVRAALIRGSYDVVVLDNRRYGRQLLRVMASGQSGTAAVMIVDHIPADPATAGVMCEFVPRAAARSACLAEAVHSVALRAASARGVGRTHAWWRWHGPNVAYVQPAETQEGNKHHKLLTSGTKMHEFPAPWCLDGFDGSAPEDALSTNLFSSASPVGSTTLFPEYAQDKGDNTVPFFAPGRVDKSSCDNVSAECPDDVSTIVGRIDSQGRIRQAEGKGLETVGIDPERLRGMPFTRIFPASAAALEQARSRGSAHFSTNLRNPDEPARPAVVHLLFDPGSRGTAFFVHPERTKGPTPRDVLLAVDAERQRIGADLHDEVGQLLTGISCMSAALLDRLRGRDDVATGEANMIVEVAKEALSQLRSLVRGLAPVGIGSHGLTVVLEDMAERFRRMHDIAVELAFPENGIDLDDETAGHVLRIVQEAAANAVRHGHAERIFISLTSEEAGYRLEVSDNGCGFDHSSPRCATGTGLQLMKYRASLIGGAITISSQPASGTRILVSFTPEKPAHHHEDAC